MPTIRQYTRQRTPQSGLATRRATASDFGGGAGLEQAGQNLQRFGVMMEQRAERNTAVEIDKKLLEAEMQFRKREAALEQEAELGADGHVSTVEQEIEGYARSFRSNFDMLSEDNASRLEMGLTRLRSSIVGRAITFEAASQAKKVRTDVETGLDDIQAMVRDGSLTIDEGQERADSLIGGARLPGNTRQELSEVITSNMAAAQIRYLLDNADTPEQVVALREDAEGLRDRMTAGQYDKVLSTLDRAEEKLRVKREQRFLNDYRDTLGLARAGLADPVSEDVIRANVTDPDQQQDLVEQMERAAAEGRIHRQIDFMPRRDIEAVRQGLLGRAENESLDPADRRSAIDELSRFDQAVDNRDDRINADPVGFIWQNAEEMPRQYAAWSEAEQAAQGSPEDDSLQNAAADARDAYVEDMRAYQQRLGIRDPKLLPSTQVAQIKAAVEGVERSPQGAQQLVGIMGGYAEQWGEYYPDVFRQLVEEDALSGEYVVLGRIANDPGRNATAVKLATALMTSEKDMFASVPNGNTTKSDISTAVNETMLEFGQTLGWQGAARTRNQYTSAVNRLAAFYHTQQGVDMNDAVERAYQELVGQDYEFVGSYRVPANQVTDNISSGASYIKNDRLMDFDIVPAIGMDGSPMPRDEQVSVLADRGRWVTAGSEQGLMLLDEMGRPVMVRQGDENVPLVVEWDKISDYAYQARDFATRSRYERRRGGAQEPDTISQNDDIQTGDTATAGGLFSDVETALVDIESGGDPNAVSSKGARGLFQIMPETAANPGYGIDSINLDTATEAEQRRFASDYLNAMSEEFDGDEALALAAYNAGPERVRQFVDEGRALPQETMDYIRKFVARGALSADNSVLN